MRTTVEQVRCDLCGYGGPWSRPEDFTSHAGDVDLCRWCSDPKVMTSMESGGHCVTFAPDHKSWECSCGEKFRRPLLIPPRVVAAVPNLPVACAHAHLNDQQVPA